MNGSLYLVILVFVIAGAAELYYRWRNPHPIITVAIEPCPICGANAELDGVGQDTFVRCLNHNCAMQGPYGKDEIAAVTAWNAIPSMSSLIAWQFQAAGAALENQRLRAVLKSVEEIVLEAPELNMSNFDEDQIYSINEAMISICGILLQESARNDLEARNG